MDRDKKKVDKEHEFVTVTQPMQRYGKQELCTMTVPNPNYKFKKKRKYHEA